MFALVDCNNFYASCERVFRPDLNKKAVVVLSNNDGCVIARSNEAKALNIPMGAPAFKYQKIFDEHHVHVFSSNYSLYGDMSSRVMNILSSLSPEIEIYSIDEAFLKLDGFELKDLSTHALKMKKVVSQSTGIPVSIGLAKTKALAKVANKIAKKFSKRTNGVYIIDNDKKRIKALKWLNIKDVWGIGRRHAKRLQVLGIENAYEFTQKSDQWIKKNMSIVGLKLKHELEGKPRLTLEYSKAKKSIATTRTFERPYTKLDDIRESITTFSVSCAEKLRKQKSCCNVIMVFVHTNGFRKDLPQYSKSIIISLPYPTNSSIELTKFAYKALKSIFKLGFEYKKAGVIAMDIVPENQQQINLFENSDPRHKTLMKIIDQINDGIGQKKVRIGSQGTGRTWKMRQELLSPKYTTKLSDIISVNV